MKKLKALIDVVRFFVEAWRHRKDGWHVDCSMQEWRRHAG
jgi:hypothetical protein